MADKLFKDYFQERLEDGSIVDDSKVLIQRGNNVRKIDVDKFATAAQGVKADNSVQLTGDQNIDGVKTFNDDLGIGTNSPEHQLHVVSSEQCPALFESNVAGGGIALMDNTTTDDEQVGIGAFGDHLCFRSGGAAAGNMRLTSNGNLGIGTTSPSEKLEVNGNTKITGVIDLNDGSNRTIIGTSAGSNGSNQTAVGCQAALFATGSNQTAVGFDAGRASTGNNQTAIGYFAGRINTGSNQTAIGYEAGSGNSGASQTALGYEAGEANTGELQTAVGLGAGKNNTADRQTAIGMQSGDDNSGLYQTAVGFASGRYNTGSYQAACGYASGFGNTGNLQTAIGGEAGRDNSGDNNIAIGFESSEENRGDNVLSIGFQAAKGNDQNNRTIIDNDLLPAFANFSAAESAFGAGQSGMTYLYFNTSTNAIEGVRF